MDHLRVLQDSIDYIEDNLKTNIRAEELAQMASFSLFHYYRLFQSATGTSVMQYILRRRLLHAIYEIHQGRRKIEAAMDYGFDTYAGFYKAFQREFGCTPSVFLQANRAKKPYRLNLMKEEHMIVTHKKASEVLSHWNLETQVVSDIYFDGTGGRNENAFYIGDTYILKYTANLGKLKKHITVSRALEQAGLYAATAIPTADGKEYIADGELFFFLTRRLPGSQIVPGQLLESNPLRSGCFIGEIIGQLHLALADMDLPVREADLFATVKDWALPNAKAVLGWDETDCKAYLDTFSAGYPQLPRQIIHRDPNPGNIIHSEGKWGFIDFELSERNARIYDPCYAATAILSEIFNSADDAMLDSWLHLYRGIIMGYHSVIHLTEAEQKAVPCLILANQLVCIAWFAENPKYAELLDINKRMTLWLTAHMDALKIEL